MRLKSALIVVVWITVPGVGLAQPGSQGIPTPATYLGFEVGTDRRLADWEEITGYFSLLANKSDRVRLDTLGATTLGRPFVALTISSVENLVRLDELLEVQRKLADPRRVATELEAERLIEQGRAVVLITAGIHSTEVGGFQVPLRLAYHLASRNDPTTRLILDQVILLMVPSLNPDGSQMVVDWYESTLGEPWEGASPPFLYHHYVGHDNNRDWYAFTQKETRHTVTKLHNVWHPQIVHDIHQMGSEGPRFFIPPWTDPIEPNVDPLLVAGINALGTAMAWEMYGEGKTGIVVNAIFDAWTPARAYQHYHGGVRILTETASAKLATPIVVPFDSLGARRGLDAQEPSWRFPDPWPGGDWRLSDIVDYMESGALALLKQAALYRERWLRNFYRIGLRAIALREGWPAAYLIPPTGQNPDGLAELLRVLVTGDVEVRRAATSFAAEGRQYPAGTYVIPIAQPYGGFAKTVLEAQRYPELREYPGGPLRAPYDATAHTLPLLMGVEVVALREGPEVKLSSPITAPRQEKQVPGLSDGPRQPRVAIYEPYVPSMDAGWTRWIFDEYQIPLRQLRDAEVRAGRLREKYDAIILPDMSAETMIAGHAAGEMPAKYVGGLGESGVTALDEFVRSGGTLIAFNRGSQLPIEQFGLPVVNTLQELERSEFYIPGSILRLRLAPNHWLAEGMPERTIAWFERGLAFEPTAGADGRVEIIGRFGGEDDLLLSGWISGSQFISGGGAIALVGHGSGRVILFGFRPQYRAQSIATYPLFFNAIKRSLRSVSTQEPAARLGQPW